MLDPDLSPKIEGWRSKNGKFVASLNVYNYDFFQATHPRTWKNEQRGCRVGRYSQQYSAHDMGMGQMVKIDNPKLSQTIQCYAQEGWAAWISQTCRYWLHKSRKRPTSPYKHGISLNPNITIFDSDSRFFPRKSQFLIGESPFFIGTS